MMLFYRLLTFFVASFIIGIIAPKLSVWRRLGIMVVVIIACGIADVLR